MKRRQFITLLGSAAAWPLAARAQSKVRRIGALILGIADAESFRTELREEPQPPWRERHRRVAARTRVPRQMR